MDASTTSRKYNRYGSSIIFISGARKSYQCFIEYEILTLS